MPVTKIINIFNTTPRTIRCVKNQYDLLGDGSLVTEADLEVGKLYNAYNFEMHSYGPMVFIQEVHEDYGFAAELFEETEAYDAAIVTSAYNDWLFQELAKGEESLKRGEGIPAEEVFKKIHEKYGTS